MGTRNRERRKAKQKRRAQSDPRLPPRRRSAAPPWGGESVAPGDLFVSFAHLLGAGGGPAVPEIVEALAEGWLTPGGRGLAEGAGRQLAQAVDLLWHHGWQPLDVASHIGRTRKAAHLALAGVAVRVDAARYRGATGADPRWLGQVEAMPGSEPTGAAPGDPPGRGALPWLAAWAAAEGYEPAEAVVVAAELFLSLVQVPPLHQLSDPPHRWGRTATPRADIPAGLDHKVLAKVRALLAKAESTTFTAECDALTAKAQQLIAAHAIDRALLDAGDDHGDATPLEIRLWIDNPYTDAKSTLLSEVASAGRCSVVIMSGLGCCSVFGMAGDVEAVELLFTSLLVQATHEMVAVGAQQPGGRHRSRGFRQSFLTSFAVRIGDRLRQASAQVVDEATAANGALLPVLASQHERVQAAVDEAYPNLRSKRLSNPDHAGWVAGALAADRAQVAPGGAVRPAS